MDCGDNIHDGLLGPPTSQAPPLAYLLPALTLHPAPSSSPGRPRQLWVWFPHFVWNCEIKLQHRGNLGCVCVTWEAFVLWAEPKYLDLKMNDFPFATLYLPSTQKGIKSYWDGRRISIRLPSPIPQVNEMSSNWNNVPGPKLTIHGVIIFRSSSRKA